MASKDPTSKRLPVAVDADQYQVLSAIKDREGLPIAFQVRKAITAYLQARGELDSPRPPHLDVHA